MKRGAGFTLVEMMVALALLALLAALLHGGLRQGTRSWGAVESASDETAALLHTQTLLREMLGGVGEIWPGEDRVVLAGSPRGVVFDAVWLGDLPAAAIHRIAFETTTEHPSVLAMRWRPVNGGAEDRRNLLDGIETAEWRFFGTKEQDTSPRWHDEWREADRLPRLIEVRLTFSDPRRVWPPFVAEIP